MVKSCCVKYCKSESYAGCGISFHKFPKDEDRKKKWLDIVPSSQKITKNSVVCSNHFKKEDFQEVCSRQLLKEHVIPSIFPLIRYRRSGWSVEEFEVWSGGAVCRCAAVRAADSLLVWLGASGAAPRLSEAALAMPDREARSALSTALLGDGASAAPLATRLAAALCCPVYVCSGTSFDRFTLPLVERALVTEIRKKPDCL